MKKILASFFSLLIVAGLCACSFLADTPTSVTDAALHAVTKGKLPKLSGILSDDSASSLATSADFLPILLSEMEYEVVSEQISDDRATVKLSITNKNRPPHKNRLIKGLITYADERPIFKIYRKDSLSHANMQEFITK